MASCTIIFSRQSGIGLTDAKATGFVAETLRPMLEERAGKRVHVIHDVTATLPMSDDLVKHFEALVGKSRFIRDLKQIDKEWRLDAKSSIARLDSGEACPMLSDLPETSVIMEANLRNPDSVRNHLAFYPFDSVIEAGRFRINMKLAREKVKAGKVEEAVDNLVEAHNALAARNLHSDIELMKQIRMIGGDVIVLRNLSHAYLVNIDRYDIAVADGLHVISFAELVRKNGISLYPVMETMDLTFAEKAVTTLCSGGIDKDKHRKQAVLEILFSRHMEANGLWDRPGGISEGLSHVSNAPAHNGQPLSLSL